MTPLVALSVTLILAAAVSFTAGKIEDNGFGSVLDKGAFGILTTPVMNMACRAIDSTDASISDTRKELGNYLARENEEKHRVAKTRPSIRIVDENFKGKYCLRIRDAGIDFPTPIPEQNIEILNKVPAMDLYINEYGEMVTPENIAKRAEELTALLKKASVTDADLSKRYVFNFIPGEYRLGFKKQ